MYVTVFRLLTGLQNLIATITHFSVKLFVVGIFCFKMNYKDQFTNSILC